ncbi:hypothetical protein EDD92_9421 [Streptomyces sp. TLI_185]|nr:hypothetical protein EDD92_9421 [Streptomyces sp. TLI_185]
MISLAPAHQAAAEIRRQAALHLNGRALTSTSLTRPVASALAETVHVTPVTNSVHITVLAVRSLAAIRGIKGTRNADATSTPTAAGFCWTGQSCRGRDDLRTRGSRGEATVRVGRRARALAATARPVPDERGVTSRSPSGLSIFSTTTVGRRAACCCHTELTDDPGLFLGWRAWAARLLSNTPSPAYSPNSASTTTNSGSRPDDAPCIGPRARCRGRRGSMPPGLAGPGLHTSRHTVLPTGSSLNPAVEVNAVSGGDRVD